MTQRDSGTSIPTRTSGERWSAGAGQAAGYEDRIAALHRVMMTGRTGEHSERHEGYRANGTHESTLITPERRAKGLGLDALRLYRFYRRDARIVWVKVPGDRLAWLTSGQFDVLRVAREHLDGEPMTQRAIAAEAGVSVSVVARALALFERVGLLASTTIRGRLGGTILRSIKAIRVNVPTLFPMVGTFTAARAVSGDDWQARADAAWARGQAARAPA